MPDPLYIKKNDLQPYYYGAVVNSANAVVPITGATIYCTMKNAVSGALKITRQTTGITITDGSNGLFEYHWQATDTDTSGKYFIEFEINPGSGGKFTVPVKSDDAIVMIVDSLDTI